MRVYLKLLFHDKELERLISHDFYLVWSLLDREVGTMYGSQLCFTRPPFSAPAFSYLITRA